MAERFYLPELTETGYCTLEGPEAHHLLHVTRHGIGDIVILFDGRGLAVYAQLESATKKSATLTIRETIPPQTYSTRGLTIASPLPKGDRALFMIEKLTELGVTCFQPLKTARSIVHPGQGKLDKLRQKVVEACKQSGRNTLMEVKETCDWVEFHSISHLSPRGGKEANSTNLIAHPGGEAINNQLLGIHSTVISIGPEGGFTEKELEMAIQSGWQVVSLGSNILRIETAAIAASSIVACI